MGYYIIFNMDIFTDYAVCGDWDSLEQFEQWITPQRTLDELINKCKQLSLKMDCTIKCGMSQNVDGAKIAAHVNSLAKLNDILVEDPRIYDVY